MDARGWEVMLIQSPFLSLQAVWLMLTCWVGGPARWQGSAEGRGGVSAVADHDS